MLGHLSPLIPSERPTQCLGQGDDRARNGVAHRFSTMPGECGPVFHASVVTMAGHAWQVQQQGEARGALHQGANRGTAKAHDEIPFPMTRHGAINCLRGTFADHDLGRDEGLSPAAGARPRRPQRPAAAQAGRQLAAQCAPPLHKQRLVDGLMADAQVSSSGKSTCRRRAPGSMRLPIADPSAVHADGPSRTRPGREQEPRPER
jgi:hypothetical protein